MKLTQTHIDAINKTWPSPRTCPACRNNGPWDLVTIGEVREYCDAYHVPGAPMVPVLMVTCTHCFCVLFFHATRMGLVDKDGTAKP